MVVSKESCQSSEKDQKQSSAKAQRLKAIEEGNEILIDEIVKLRELRHLILGVIPIVVSYLSIVKCWLFKSFKCLSVQFYWFIGR